ncbi:MAG: SDR family oxidoreductase [Methanobrevibacter sp.]|nr:SDR family oxidoreductase [Methanobrevibacter sp.]
MKNYILITGASSGIGRETAIMLSKNYSLILNGRDIERLNETKNLCNNSNESILWQYDLSDVKHINENLSTLINEKNISISGFVHSAGVSHLSPLHLTLQTVIDEVMNVNFFSAVEILKLLLNKKLNAKFLTDVIFVSSISSCRGAKGMSIYSASKGALDSFARSMAYELAPKVRVNTVQPGGIPTRRGGGSGFIQSDTTGYLLGEGHVNDVASMIEFILSERARWITGQNFVVDGGKISHC